MTWKLRGTVVAAGVAVVVLAAVAINLLTPVGTDPYPYRLPWASGEVNQHSVIQGNFGADAFGACISGCATHGDPGQHFAWDFDLPEGTDVLAARAGRVGLAFGGWPPDHCGGLAPVAHPPPGYLVSPVMGNQTNLVRIDHGDGTSALYLHLRSVSDEVLRKAATAGRVEQGDVLGRSGRTGLTQCQPHLHFQVETTVRGDWFTTSLPIGFGDTDVLSKAPGGVPVEGETYVSDNAPPAAH